MQQLENTVVELRIIQRFGDELAARGGFDGLVGIEADERSRSVGIVIIEPDHARVFIVDLASGRAVVPYIGIGSRRCPGGRRSTDLSDEAGAGYKTDLRSIQALAQPLVGRIEEQFVAEDGTTQGSSKLIQQEWIR